MQSMIESFSADSEVSDSDILDNTLNLICSLKTTAQKPTLIRTNSKSKDEKGVASTDLLPNSLDLVN